jgi:hypothetical protein
MTGAGDLLRAAELLQLGVAADEPRQPPSDGRLQAGPRLAGPRHLVDLHRLGEAPHRHGAERLHLDVALDQRQRLGRDHDRAGIGDLLHPRGQVRSLSHRGVVHVEIAADGAHDDLPGVQPDTDLDHGRVRASYVFRVLLHAFLHPDRRIAGPHGVVLMGERRAEQRHDPVAHHLVDRALIAVDGLHHPFEHRIEEFAGLLGIAISEQLHGALEVGEEHGHLLALAFERGFRVDDPLGENAGVYDAGETGAFAEELARPHSGQNFAVADSSLPQLGHRGANPVPHSSQNFAPRRISWEQRGHCITCAR